MVGGSGADILTGGTGIDTASYSTASSAIKADLGNSGNNTGTDASGDSYNSIEDLIGSSFNDILVGDNNANRLTGGAGNDILIGNGGADILDGGTGTDTADYSTATSGVVANLTNPALNTGDAAGDTYISIENLTGSNFNDVLGGNSGANVLNGGTGGTDTADYSTSTIGLTVSLADPGNNTGDAAGDTYISIENLTGSDNNDFLTGDSGDNVLSGGFGNDTLVGLVGSDKLDGGAGFDTADYSASSSAVTVNLAANTGIGGAAAGDTYVNIENVIGSNQADYLTGNSADNLISGGAGDDTLVGLGRDTDGDILDGGSGRDTADYSASPSAVLVDLTASQQNAGGDAEHDSLISIEDVIGSSGNDTFFANSSVNFFNGGAGLDEVSYLYSDAAVTVSTNHGYFSYADEDTYSSIEIITGSAYGDTLFANVNNSLYGGGGNDTLFSTIGSNTLDGGSESDFVNYSLATQGLTINLVSGVASNGSTQDSLVNIENVVGSDFNDTITPNSAANSLSGGGGIDTVDYSDFSNVVGVSVDLVNGGLLGNAQGDLYSGIENIIGTLLNDSLTGDFNANVLMGGNGNDSLVGGFGNDTLIGGGGGDILVGGDDTDVVDYSTSSQGVTVILTGTGSNGDAQGDTYSQIENIIGSNFNDVLTGDSGANVLSGGIGSDTADYSTSTLATGLVVSLSNPASSNTGDAAGDTYISIENLTGSNYNDSLTGDPGANILSGGLGNDLLVGLAGADTFDGGSGTDTIDYSSSAIGLTVNLNSPASNTGDAAGDNYINIENLIGTAQADILTGNSAANSITGGAGDDILAGLGGADSLDGGAGINTADYSTSGAVNVNLSTGINTGGDAGGDVLTNILNITGSSSADTLAGDANSNFLSGGAGNDSLIGGPGADTMDGGADIDTLSYAASSVGVIVNLVTGTGSNGDAAGDVLTGIENVFGSSTGANNITGDGSANNFMGGNANDTILGGDGNDTIFGLNGGDSMDGGAGFNTLAYSTGSSVGVNVSLATGTGTFGFAQGDTFINFQAIVGGTGNDTLAGDSGNNTLSGQNANDWLMGDAGADSITGNSGIDTLDFSASIAGIGVNVNFITGTGSFGDAQGDLYNNLENIIGTTYSDTLIGDDTNGNSITGGSGNDSLAGNGGNDTLIGGIGADNLDGGAGTDTADYSGSSAGVNVDLSAGVGTFGDAQGDTLVNIENVIGSSGNDTFSSNALANQFTGGLGNDTYMFNNNAAQGSDTITETTSGGTDTIDFTGSNENITFNLGSTSSQQVGTSGNLFLTLTNAQIENIIGGSANNTLTGNSSPNVLTGGASNDSLVGLGGDDTYAFNTTTPLGSDTINEASSGGTDTIDFTGSTVDITLDLGSTSTQGVSSGTFLTLTNAQVENVIGGSGNDLFFANNLANSFTGGLGSDTVSYAAAATAVTINLLTSTGSGDVLAVGDTFSSIENIIGTAFNDNLTGNTGNNTFTGGAGADTITGGGGTDTASYANSAAGVSVDLTLGSQTGTGDPSGDVLSGIANLTGSLLNDTLSGDNNANYLSGLDGNDSLTGGAGGDTIDGGNGSDFVNYLTSASAVNINLGLGSASGGDAQGDVLISIESIRGSAGNDTIIGGSSTNIIIGAAGADLLDGGGANPIVNLSYSGSSAGVDVSLVRGTGIGGDAQGDVFVNFDWLIGSSFNDTLAGNANANVLNAAAGADVLKGDAGADTWAGGGGIDTADYTASTAGVNVNFTTNVGSGGDAAGDTYSGMEYITGSAFGDTLVGDDTNGNLLNGGAGNDTINGGGGNDTLIGGTGADTLEGGAGTDTADYSSSASAVNVDLSTGVGTGGEAAGDVLTNIENIIGSGSDDTFVSDINANLFTGGLGNDTYIFNTSTALNNDTVTEAAAGGTDTVSFAGSTAGVAINLALTTAQSINNLNLTLSAAQVENVIGGSGNDTIAGNASANVLTGGLGNDTYSFVATSALGSDTVTEAASGGTDIIDFTGTTLASTFNLGLTTAQTVNANLTLTLSATEVENVTGGSGADSLTGNNNPNIFIGASGNDTLSGLGGNDTYAFNTTSALGSDNIIDAAGNGTDTLDFTGSTAALTINLGTLGSSQTVSGANLSLTLAAGDEIENVIGGSGADTITGNALSNTFTGNAGNDSLSGLTGNDTYAFNTTSALGTDTVVDAASSGTDTLDFTGSTTALTINLGTLGSSQVVNGNLTLTLAAGDEIENVIAGSGDDSITANSLSNALTGGLGNDTYFFNASSALGSDTVTEAAAGGTDTIDLTGTTLGSTLSLASTASQVVNTNLTLQFTATELENIIGGSGNDNFTGNASANTFIGGAGADTITGGGGTDTASYANSAAAVSVDLTLVGAQTGSGDASGDVLSGITNLIGSDVTGDILVGNSSANYLSGLSGSDFLIGGAGADTLDGGAANNDSASYANAAAAVVASLIDPASNTGDAAGDNYISIESLIGSDFNDSLVGDSAGNGLTGGLGNDTLDGGAGADNLIGGAGADSLIGGAGTGDTLVYTSSPSAVNINLQTGAASGGDAAGDTFTGVEWIAGSAFDDTLAGDINANNLTGQGGNDLLMGDLGADTLVGSSGTDTVNYSASSAGVNVNLATGVGSGGDAAGDTYTTIENITGSANADTMVGDSNANSISGGAGNDIYAFNTTSALGSDTIVDAASSGTDTLDFTGSTTALAINLGTLGSSQVVSGNLTLTLAAGDEIENVIGGSGADSITSNSLANALTGAAGNDTYLYNTSSAQGSDTITEAAAGGSDTLDFTGSTLGVSVNLTQATTQVVNANLSLTLTTGTDTNPAEIENIIGGAGNDFFTANSVANVFTGAGGTDTVSYAGSATGVNANLTTNTGSSGNAAGDTYSSIENLIGSSFADTLNGSAGANSLIGGAGADSLIGGGGNDTYVYDTSSTNLGTDFISFGAGIDLLDFSNSTNNVTVDLSITGNQTVNSNLNFNFVNTAVENITGGSGANTFVANSLANIFTGGAGTNDTVSYAGSTAVNVNLATNTGTGGNAAGDAYVGIENLIGSSNADTLTGNNFNNILIGGAGADSLDGGAGTGDSASYSTAAAAVLVNMGTPASNTGDAAGDTYANIENLIGSSFNDTLSGNSSANVISGGLGNDSYLFVTTSALGNDTVTETSGQGTDTLDFTGSTLAVNVDLGSASAQAINANLNLTLTNPTQIENVTGGSGNDTFISSSIGNAFNGGAGTDTVSYTNSPGGLVVDLGNPASNTLDAAGDTYTSIENLTGSVWNDTLTGDANANVIDGGTNGNDNMTGGGGNDTYIMNTSSIIADTVTGGAGTDTLNFGSDTLGVTVNLNTTGSQVVNSNFTLNLTTVSIENIIGGTGTNLYLANNLSNSFNGVLSANDTVSYSASTAGVNVNLAGTGSGGYAANDVYTAIENVIGSSFVDTLTGDAGNNILTGGAGADSLAGSNGTDTADYSTASLGVVASLSTPASNTNDAAGDTYNSIENLSGSGFNDSLTGDNNANVLTGGAGNDSLDGAGGNDTLIGGAGADTLVGNAGTDWADYSTATAAVGANLNNAALNSGDAFGDTYTTIENLSGSNFDDILTGNGGNNSITGGAGNDTIAGLSGNDTIDGGTGNNTVDYSASISSGINIDLTRSSATNQPDGNAANDRIVIGTIQNIIGSGFADTIVGDANDNIFTGGAGNDIISGGGGSDRYLFNTNSALGSDTLTFGAGVDVLDFSASSLFQISINLTLSTAQSMTGLTLTFTNPTALENVIGGSNDDTFVANSLGNAFTGGAGTDTVSYASSAAGVLVDMITVGNNTGDAAGDAYNTIENITGSNFNDTLNGNNSSNSINGGSGADIINGLGGGDILIGGPGADTFDGGSGNDTVDYSSSAAVTVNLSIGTAQVSGNDANGDVITLNTVENLTGSSTGNDVLTGDANANVIKGGGGADTIVGGGGNDTIIGGTGADNLDGGTGIDVLDYSTSASGVNVNLGTNTVSGGDAAGDLLVANSFESVVGSLQADTLTGDGNANLLVGISGADSLSGGGGNDTLQGDDGNDTMAGGTGADNFKFAAGYGADQITDFLTGTDKIDLTAFGTNFANLTNINGNTADGNLTFSGGNSFIDFGSGNVITVLAVDLTTHPTDFLF